MGYAAERARINRRMANDDGEVYSGWCLLVAARSRRYYGWLVYVTSWIWLILVEVKTGRGARELM